MSAIHAQLAAGRWQTLSLAEQLAHVGSEVGRCLSWRRRGHDALAAGAFDRALELLDLTLTDARWRGRRREICRAREILCDHVLGDNTARSTPESLDRYFLSFAVLARRRHVTA